MKFGIGLAAALAAALILPGAAFAQAKIDPKAKAAGMADAPALVQTFGMTCTLSDAALLGESTAKDAAGKTVKSKIYEIACSEGGGYVLGNPSPAPINCLILETAANQTGPNGKKIGGTTCKLPENADPKTVVNAPARAAGITCAIDKVRWVGASATSKVDVYEIGCADGQASLLNVPQSGSTEKLAAENCMKAMSQGGNQCQFYSKEAANKSVAALVAKSSRACQVSDSRFVGTKTTGGDFFEVACQDGKTGFMLETDKAGAYSRTIDCAMADSVAGGCTLTKVSVTGNTEELPLYNKKAKEIGFACNVSSYRSMGLDASGREIVELACSDRADGAFALLPVSAGQKGETSNCVRSEVKGQLCKLSDKAAVYTKLSNQITNKGKACPAVTKTRPVGQGPGGEAVVEALCGATSYIVVFNKDSDGVLQIQTCAEAKSTGASCTLK